MLIDHHILSRLSYVKYLYSLALEQSYKPGLLNSFSILTFHDAAELFLQISADYLKIAKRIHEFMKYWPEINQKLGDNKLSQERLMYKLNHARVALKHHGTLPFPRDIDEYRITLKNFFEENTEIVFGLKFDEISLVEAIHSEKVRTSLIEANQYRLQGKLRDAIIQIAIAFEHLIREHSGKDYLLDVSSRNVHRMTFPPFYSKKGPNDSRILEYIEEISKAIQNTDQRIDKLIDHIHFRNLGIDRGKYYRFKKLAPHINMYMDGHSEAVFLRAVPNINEINFCFDFVIESVLSAQDSI